MSTPQGREAGLVTAGAPRVDQGRAHYELTGRAYVPPLDGIRGIAVAMVMVRHFGQGWETDMPLDKVLFTLTRLGSNGVDMFFVLSGFLITGILMDTKEKAGYFRNFYARRTVRIFPLYYLALAFSFILWPSIADGRVESTVGQAGEYQAWFWLYASNILFAVKQMYIGLTHFWSLAVEEQFYLFWPLIVYLLPRNGLLWACLACVLIAFATRIICAALDLAPLVPYVLLPGRIDALAAGAFIAVMARRPSGIAPITRRAPLVLIGTVLVAVATVAISYALGSEGRTHAVNIIAGSLVAFFFGAIVTLTVGLPKGSLLDRFFSFWFFRTLGKYSYCLYVVHPLFQQWFEWRWSDDYLPRIAGSPLPGRLAFMLICGAGSLAIAFVSWHVFEKQWLKLKEFF